MFHRRDILKAALATAALPALKLPAYAAPARRFIDIHCHFFNAADLPVRGFLQRVVLSDYATTSLPQSAAGTPSQSVWKGLAAKLTDLILKYEAPAAQAELACLKDADACPGYSAGGARARIAAGSLKSGIQGSPAEAKAIADVLVEHYEARGARPKADLPDAPLDSGFDTDAFVDFVLKEMEMAGEGAPGASSRSMKGLGSSLSNAAAAMGAYIASGRSIFSRYFAWGELLVGYRESIIETYYSLYDPQNTRIILTAPLLVDYNYWLQDQTPSPLRDQMEVMSTLSLRQPRPMHGFMAFDPLREVRRKPEEPSPLAIVQEAVTKHGFLGVKLYSPMGFKPTGNAAQGIGFPAYASMSEPGFGAALDGALDMLYAWCEKNEVPIVAHTADTQAAGPGYGTRAEPRLWAKVLAKYPKLKLDLAHFGLFQQVMNSPDAAKQFAKTWESEIGAFIKGGKFPNVYADISYFYWVLEGAADKDHVEAVKKLFAKYFETDPQCKRLMYGTDWNMTGRAQGAEQYVDNVEAFFRGLGLNERQLDNLFYKNALRFLGLGRRGKAEARLKAFYAAAGRPYPAFA